MMTGSFSIGIIGGSGMLGGAIARALLQQGDWPASRLWISNRGGSRAGFDDHPHVTVTTDNQQLASACDLILLAVPPEHADDLRIRASDRLVVSVMAGITVQRITRLTGAARVVRAMSSPAAERGLAYSPWFGTAALTARDEARVTALFTPCGLTDRIAQEDQIDLFTAMTGPVPGFVALFAQLVAGYATQHGIPPRIADRAVRQLFLGAGIIMAEDAKSPDEHVQEMIDYAGTTAAGLQSLQGSSIAQDLRAGLDASVARARALGETD